MSLILGSRIHNSVGNETTDLEWIENWCSQAIKYADYVAIATDKQLFKKISHIVSAFGDRVHPLLVNPWKGFAHPLNAIVREATLLDSDKVLFQSMEVDVSSTDVEILNFHLSSDTLVVGAKMTPIHGGNAGIKPIDGMNSPWNTFALWNLSKLKRTGFIEVSSEILDIPGGMEEVTTISVLQQVYPNQARAKLVGLSQLNWKCSWNSEKRQEYHKKKMSSKLWRAEMQLKYSKVQRGVVTVL